MQTSNLLPIRSILIFGTLGGLTGSALSLYGEYVQSVKMFIPMMFIFGVPLVAATVAGMFKNGFTNNFVNRFATSFLTYMTIVAVSFAALGMFSSSVSFGTMTAYEGLFIGSNIILWGAAASAFVALNLGFVRNLFLAKRG